MTILEALDRADTLAPNAIGQEQKLLWLRQAEDLIQAAILNPSQPLKQPSFDESTPLSTDLALESPWDALYIHWLEMQICYAQGETGRYNQANALYRAVWSGCRDHYHRTHLPPARSARYF